MRVGLVTMAIALLLAASAQAQGVPEAAIVGVPAGPGPTIPGDNTVGSFACSGDCLIAQAYDPTPYLVPFDGVINEWNTGDSGGIGTVSLVVLRETSPGLFTVVSSSTSHAVRASFIPSAWSTWQPVQAGDRIAVAVIGQVTVRIRRPPGSPRPGTRDPVVPGAPVLGQVFPGPSGYVNVPITPLPRPSGSSGRTITTTDGMLELAATVIQPAVVTAISPAHGPDAGGTRITLTGENLGFVTSMTIGGKPAAFTVVGPTTLTATTPAGTAGVAEVVVATSRATSLTTEASHFTYDAPAACVVPDLRRRTLPGARTLLTRAHCALGAVTRSGRGARVVAAQSRRAGATLPGGATVGVTLRPKRR